ncbi:MAG: lysozyme inhibitor LprI family protein [Bacteroidota bacterium]
MKPLLLSIALLIAVFSFCQTQTDMNIESYETYNKADKELNYVYQKVLVKYQTDTAFIKNLRISQRNWIVYRDSELKMKYPEREQGYFGTMQPMCENDYLTELTKERIRTLNLWLTGAKPEDDCSGSIKNNN